MINFLRILLISAALFITPSCVSSPDAVPSLEGLDRPATIEVSLVHNGLTLEDGERLFTDVRVQFYISDRFYSHVVQEIVMSDGSVLIEAFENDGYITDHHYWIIRPNWRHMKLYAANVVGMDDENGWGHLPDNGQGLSTDIGFRFNWPYQRDYETRGTIKSRSIVATYWYIVDDGLTVTVLLPA